MTTLFEPLGPGTNASSSGQVAYFRRWATLFHVVFFGGLALMLALRWTRPGFAWSPTDTVLFAVVLAQVALEVRFLLHPSQDHRGWMVHLGLGLGLWYLQWQLEPLFVWLFLPYLGLMTSWLSPRLIQRLDVAQYDLELAGHREAELIALRERERLARDLHDSLGHALVTLTVQLEASQRLLTVDPARCRSMLDQLQALTRGTMEALRRSLANLRAPGLGERPLTVALAALVAEAQQRAHLATECHLSPLADRLPPPVAEALWRVAQEGLANVEKHARATRISMMLTTGPDEIVLRIVDNGVGLPADATERPGHYGLRGLRERLEGLGGVFSAAASDLGTTMEARIPVVGEP